METRALASSPDVPPTRSDLLRGAVKRALSLSAGVIAANLIGTHASAAPFPAVFELASLLPANGGDGSEGFVIPGIEPAEDIPKVNVNTARAVDMEAALTLRRSQAAAVIAYREKNGPIKSLDELKKVPGLNAAHLEERKDRITF